MSGAVEHELHRRRRGRNLAVGAALLGMVALIFGVTVIKLQENARKPEMAMPQPGVVIQGQ